MIGSARMLTPAVVSSSLSFAFAMVVNISSIDAIPLFFTQPAHASRSFLRNQRTQAARDLQNQSAPEKAVLFTALLTRVN